jgi:hypothetical protein
VVDFDRGRRRRPWGLLAPVGAALVLLLLYWIAGPRLDLISPVDGESEVPAGEPLILRFTRKMDQASVEARLSITPLVPGDWSWQGASLVFEPADGWPEGAMVRVELAPGARSALFLPMLSGRSWSFDVGRLRIAYLVREFGTSILESRSLGGTESRVLVDGDVGSYGFSQNGALATIEQLSGGSVVRWRADAAATPADLYDCPSGQQCSSVAISPDGAWVAWQERTIERSSTGVVNLGQGSVWLMSATDGAPALLLSNASSDFRSPTWTTPESLAVYDEDSAALRLFERSGGRWRETEDPLDHRLGEQWAWSPDGRFVLLPEVEFTSVGGASSGGVGFYSHIYRVEVSSGLRTDLSKVEAGEVEDASPAYSPDGLMVAFARKSLDPAAWTLGRQVWVMRSDGTLARQLTSDGNLNHANISWSDDGKRLTFVVFDAASPDRPSEVWWMGVNDEEPTQLVVGGFAPQWIPQ